MSTRGNTTAVAQAFPGADPFDVAAVKARLQVRGGYEIVHESAGLEICVDVLGNGRL